MIEVDQRKVSRFLQLFLVTLVAYGVVSGRTPVAMNAGISFLVTLIPNLLERDLDVAISPALPTWISAAVTLHAVGTLGPYRSVWWWDHMTHAFSSSIVAVAGYTFFRAMEEHYEDVNLPRKFLAFFLVIFVMAFGVFWEVLEFAVGMLGEMTGTNVITQYGLEDTMKDLIFDSIGALAVAAFGEIYLKELIHQFREKLPER